MLTTGFPWLHMVGKDKEEGESRDGGGGGVLLLLLLFVLLLADTLALFGPRRSCGMFSLVWR